MISEPLAGEGQVGVAGLPRRPLDGADVDDQAPQRAAQVHHGARAAGFERAVEQGVAVDFGDRARVHCYGAGEGLHIVGKIHAIGPGEQQVALGLDEAVDRSGVDDLGIGARINLDKALRRTGQQAGRTGGEGQGAVEVKIAASYGLACVPAISAVVSFRVRLWTVNNSPPPIATV